MYFIDGFGVIRDRVENIGYCSEPMSLNQTEYEIALRVIRFESISFQTL